MRKIYEIPSVEMTQLMPATIVLAGSPQGIENGGNTEDINVPTGKPIGD